MITILIKENETRVKEIISQVLHQEGYKLLENKPGDNTVQIVKEDNSNSIANIEDTVIKLEKYLYDEKNGVLYKSILELIEKPIIERVLQRTEGTQFKAARILGINRNTMRTKIKKLGIDPQAYKIRS